MKLEFENGRSIESPAPSQIANGLANVGGDHGAFAILSNGDDFLQAAGDVASGFVVEYREGNTLYQSTSQHEPLSKVTEAFQKYARGDDSWRTDFQWVEQAFTPKSGCLGTMLFLIASATALVRHIG